VADDVGVIQKRIVENLYNAPLVVGDVSGRNPNVLFELGMRIAFDKPTIIVKDDKTAYPFDMSPVEYIQYPHGLHYREIVSFKRKLAAKLKATCEKPDSGTYLKTFGKFTVPKLEVKEVPEMEFVLGELRRMNDAILRLYSRRPRGHQQRLFSGSEIPQLTITKRIELLTDELMSNQFANRSYNIAELVAAVYDKLDPATKSSAGIDLKEYVNKLVTRRFKSS
jgi:hypothetical protein